MEEIKYRSLNLSEVLTSLKVVSSLERPTKLSVKDNVFLKVDDVYFSFFRSTTRDDVVDFLEHLCKETNKLFIVTYNRFLEISKSPNKKEIDETITQIYTLYTNVIMFHSKFDHVINIYLQDTLVKAKLEEIKEKFKNLEYNFFRNIIINNNA